jgi:hypothetical protein
LSKTKEESHEGYLSRIVKSSLYVQQIKVLDIYHNLIRSLTIDHTGYLKRLLQEAMTYYMPLLANDTKLSPLYLELKKIFQAVNLHHQYLSTKSIKNMIKA